MFKFINADNLRSIKPQVAPRGFKYGYVENLFFDDVYNELINNFPDVKEFQFVFKQNSGGGKKRFYVGPNYYSGKDYGCVCRFNNLPPIWKEFLLETASDKFINILSNITQINFNSLCNFGFTYGNAGCMQEAHIDGAVRPNDPSPVHSTIACLLYFNKNKGGTSGTCIYDKDKKTILFQVPNLRNSMSFFEQHSDSWHGFPVVPEGEDRRLISLSYSLEKKPIDINLSITHKLLCPIQKLTYKIIKYKL